MTKSYDPKNLIATWNKADDTEEVATKLSLSKDQVVQLASMYRKKGIFMKKMKKGPDKTDINDLIQFSKKFEKQTAANTH